MSSPYIPEGWIMGTLGYVMTFAILALLSAIMYVTSKVIERMKRGKEALKVTAAAPAPATPTAPAAAPAAPTAAPTAPELTPEELAAAVAAVHAHLTQRAPPPEEVPAPAITPWVLRARLDTRSYYGTLVYERIRRRRGWKGGP